MQPSSRLLSPANHAVILVGMESQMMPSVNSIAISVLRRNTAIVAGASRIFNIPTIVSVTSDRSFCGCVLQEIGSIFPQNPFNYIERNCMNAWEDEQFYQEIQISDKKKWVIAGLWTSICITAPALSAIDSGHEVYVITDACADNNPESHERAIQRMVQAGVQPITSMAYLLELQRSWLRQDTCTAVMDLVKTYGGHFGSSIYSQHLANAEPQLFP